MAPVEPASDSLAALEERIRRAVELVVRLRQERDAATTAAGEVATLRNKVTELSREVDALRAEREMVRQRVGKLLEQIDALNAV